MKQKKGYLSIIHTVSNGISFYLFYLLTTIKYVREFTLCKLPRSSKFPGGYVTELCNDFRTAEDGELVTRSFDDLGQQWRYYYKVAGGFGL